MKKIKLLIVALALLAFLPAFVLAAPYIVSGPLTGVLTYDLSINNNWSVIDHAAETDGSLLYDISSIIGDGGNVPVIARAKNFWGSSPDSNTLSINTAVPLAPTITLEFQ